MSIEKQSHKRANEGRPDPVVREQARQNLRESLGSMFEKVVSEGIDAALETIRKRFEDTGDSTIEDKKRPDDNLEFHNTKHTEDVARRVEEILRAIGADEKRVLLGKLIAAYHDTVQAYERDERKDGSVMRKRKIEENEAASYLELEAFMNKHPALFTDEDRRIAKGGIDNTVPRFDPELKTVIQPNVFKSIEATLDRQFTADSPELVERAVALADLGTAGMDGSEAFLPEGDAVFREENLDIASSLGDPEKREALMKRMMDWSRGQVTFAKRRKELLERELAGLPDAMKQQIGKLFGRFDESIAAAEKQLAKREQMSLEELAESFGYEIPARTIQ